MTIRIEDLLNYANEAMQTESDGSKDGKGVGLEPEVIGWLLGDNKTTPPVIDKVMDDAAKKINMSVALILVRRLVSMNKVLNYMGKLEEDLISDAEIINSDSATKFQRYKYFEKSFQDLLDFTRKFIGQNEHSFSHDQPADELALLLRTVDPEVLRKLVSILRSKGAAMTEKDIAALTDEEPQQVIESLIE